MNLAADLDEFVALHRAHGALKPTVGELTPNGYRLEIACPCGVTWSRTRLRTYCENIYGRSETDAAILRAAAFRS